MTLDQIGMMLKLAKVTRSKTVQTVRHNPGFVLYVPATHYMICANVVARLKLRTDNVSVQVLEGRDVMEGEHVLVRVSPPDHPHGLASPDYNDMQSVRKHAAQLKMWNTGFTVECASVTLQ